MNEFIVKCINYTCKYDLERIGEIIYESNILPVFGIRTNLELEDVEEMLGVLSVSINDLGEF